MGSKRDGRAKLAVILVCGLALCALLAACDSPQPTKEQLIDQKDAWAENVLRASIDDLVARGTIDKAPGDSKMLTDAFSYEQTTGGYDIAMKDAAVKSELTSNFTLPSGKVVLCDPDSNEKMRVFYLDGSASKYNASVPSDAPLFFPESAYGSFGEESMAELLNSVDANRFSSNLDSCDYLIAFDGVYTHVDENFYFGSIDRTSCTTFAIIVDAKAKKILHIENIGTDTPPDSVTAGGETGQMLGKELIAYLNNLLR